MKKLTKVALASLLLAGALNADSTRYWSITGSNVDTELSDSKHIEYGLNWGIKKYFDSNVIFGVQMGISYGNIEFVDETSNTKEDLSSLGINGDFRVGYSFFDRSLDLYGILGYAVEDIDGVNGLGFGYGVGVDYNFNKNWAVGVEYKNYSMSLDGVFDYDLKKTVASIKYSF